MELAGSIGMGAVIGWMVGRLEANQRLRRLLLAVGLAVFMTLLEIGWFAGMKGTLAAGIAGMLSFFIHRLWLQALKEQQH